MASDVEIKFGGDASALNATVDDVKGKIGEVGEHAQRAGDESKGAFAGFIESLEAMKGGLEHVMESLGGFQDLVVEAFAVHEIEEGIEKIKEFAESMAQLGFDTQKAMEILGASTTEIAGLQAVAAATGSSLGSLEMQLSRAFKNIVAGSKQAKEAAAYFGLSLEELAHMPMEEALGKIADAYAALPAGIERTANAQMLLGRGATALAPVLAQGAAGLEEFNAMAERTGTVLSEAMLAKMHTTHEAMTELGQAMIGLGEAVYGSLAAPLNGLIQILVDLVEGFRKAISEGGAFSGAMDVLRGALQAVEIVVAAVILDFELLAHALTFLLDVINTVSVGLDQMVNAALKPVAELLSNIYTGFSKLASGDFSGAASAFSSALSVHTDVFGDMKKAGQDMIAGLTAKWKEYAEAQRAANARYIAETHIILGTHDEEKKKIDKTSEATAELRKEWEKVMDSMKGSGGALDQLNEKLKTLQDALQSTLGGAGPGIDPGGIAKNLKDVTAASAGQYAEAIKAAAKAAGMDPDTLAKQLYQESGFKEHVTSPAGAKGFAQFMPETAKQYGVDVENAGSSIAGAGRYMADLMKQFNGNLGLALAAYNSGAGNVLKWERSGAEHMSDLSVKFKETEGYVKAITGRPLEEWRGHGAAITEADKVAKTTDAIAELKKKIEELSKGTPRDIAEAKALQDQIKGHGDVIKAKEAEIAADKEMIASETDLVKKRKDQKQLDEDILALSKLKASAKEAELKGAEAGAKGDPKAQHDAEIKLINTKMAEAKKFYGVDSAQYKQLQNEKEAADRKLADATDALSKQTLDHNLRMEKTANEEKIKVIDDNVTHNRISAEAGRAQKQAILEQEKADEVAYYAAIAKLDEGDVSKTLANKNKEAEGLQKIDIQEADAARKAADATAKEYQSMASSIVGTFTGAIKGMITGHETFRQAATKALEGLANKFIDLIGQMVSKWLAGELSKTAATTAGTAARAAAETTGSAAGMAGGIGGILKSIMASAGQAFAGVFGFLAPVMGPAAAGPAAAAESTVISVGSGLASADIGMWRVPTDQLAMVHRSELIMPATQADAFRAMLSGANPIGGGGGAGVSIHPALNMQVHALDGDSVKQFMRNNQRQMMQSLHSAVRQGAHLGLKSIS